MNDVSDANTLLNYIYKLDCVISIDEIDKKKKNTYVLNFLLFCTYAAKQRGVSLLKISTLLDFQSLNEMMNSYLQLLHISFSVRKDIFKYFYLNDLANTLILNDQKNILLNIIEYCYYFFDQDPVGKKNHLFELARAFEHLFEGRSTSGIFYTNKAEIDFICSLTILDYLKDAIPEKDFQFLSQSIYTKKDVCPTETSKNIVNIINNITLLDPCCGAGGFLLSYLYTLEDMLKDSGLLNTINLDLKTFMTNIILNKLCGIDINPFACYLTRYTLLMYCLINENCTNFNTIKEYINKLYENIKNKDFLQDSNLLKKQKHDIKDDKYSIIIGNPPYVRQELISTQTSIDGYESLSSRKTYKNNIIQSIYCYFPEYFKNSKDKISAKSDLYSYFFFKALYHLKKNGKLGFITSNSWLDTEFSLTLKNFLARHCSIRYIIDNKLARSFNQADVNTVITILSAPESVVKANHQVVFLNCLVSYDDYSIYDLSLLLANELSGKAIAKYKLRTVNQALLNRSSVERKWAALYLRSPDIYETILNKASNKLVNLKTIANTSFGIKTGVNKFFYLNDTLINKWKIPEKFQKPLLVSLKEVDNYLIQTNNLKYKLFYCDKTIHELQEAFYDNVLSYIKWGESQGYSIRPSVKNRDLWYKVPVQKEPDFVSNRFIGERFCFPELNSILVSDVFFVGRFYDRQHLTLQKALLNSTLTYLSIEVYSRKTYGVGVAYLYGPELKILNVPDYTLFSTNEEEQVVKSYKTMLERDVYKIKDEVLQADRRLIDSIIFDKINLTDIERDDFYDSLINEVSTRMNKANSVKHTTY